MSDSRTRLGEIKARRAAISPTPWQGRAHPGDTEAVSDADGDVVVYDEGPPSDADATFIAAAPDDVDWLVAEVERLRAKLSQLDNDISAPRRALAAIRHDIQATLGWDTDDATA